MLNKIEQSILLTINYFDVLEYTPTSFEVWEYLVGRNTDLDIVIKTLDELIRRGIIEMKNGFYFLPERSDLVERRQTKYDISEKFWNRAVYAAKILNFLPFIKMISVTNSLAFFNCEKGSDIDFFIIAEKGHIWTARALSSALLHILGLRRHGKKIAKRICLSFYISDERMNLRYNLRKENELFMAFWISGQAPIISHGKIFEQYKEANSWVLRYLPNSIDKITDYYLNFTDSALAKLSRKIIRALLVSPWVENIARTIQIKKIRNTQEKIGNPENIVFNDYMLKFHIHEWKREKKKDWRKLMINLKKIS